MAIEDFGEKIGGAKKDLWKERGLMLEDLEDMNSAERDKLITKDNIWKKPDYKKLVENGTSTRIAFFIKTIRDAVPTRPLIYSGEDSESKQIKQEQYIEFLGKLRDYIMSMNDDKQIINFYNDFMSKYIIKPDFSYYVKISPEASSCVDNKLLKAMQVKNLNEIDRGISKKQFLYTEDEKVLSQFRILLLDNSDVKFTTDYSNRNVIEVKTLLGKNFIYPDAKFSNPENWKNDTFFILHNSRIIANNLESIESAEKFILENFKEKVPTKTVKRRKGFIPTQLQNISRNGQDYRKGKDITGNDMLEVFNFKGGEFGNWLNDNDRQQSLNYGYDALLDLSKALSISPTDISLGNRLSIAFGSRGSGAALAHYEPDREVINLTKMKGAGSLAHEWGHALDDIIGKELGYKGFLTENYKFNDAILSDLVETMKYKIVCDDKSKEQQIKRYESQINRLKNYINMCFPKEHLKEEQIEKKNVLIENLINNSESIASNIIEYLSAAETKKNIEVEELSKLRKETVGKSLPKDFKSRIAYLQYDIFNAKKQIGEKEKVKTDFYKNSIAFDEMYAKTDHGYWQSTIEMFARSFACYVADKLEYKSDYLCGHADLALGMGLNKDNELEIIKAFPEGEERTLINEKIDKLIEFLKEKNILHDYQNQLENDNYDYDY